MSRAHRLRWSPSSYLLAMRALPVSPPSPFAARLWRRQDLTNGRAAEICAFPSVVDDSTVEGLKSVCLAAVVGDFAPAYVVSSLIRRSVDSRSPTSFHIRLLI